MIVLSFHSLVAFVLNSQEIVIIRNDSINIFNLINVCITYVFFFYLQKWDFQQAQRTHVYDGTWFALLLHVENIQMLTHLQTSPTECFGLFYSTWYLFGHFTQAVNAFNDNNFEKIEIDSGFDFKIRGMKIVPFCCQFHPIIYLIWFNCLFI